MIRLLIVDDEMLVLVGIQSMLDWNALGVEVVGTAHNGGEAMAKINTLKPDIVIIDINMPVKNGLDVARECKEKYGRLPLFIFLTSYEEFSFAREAVSVRAVDYLVKISLTPKELSEAIKRAIGIVLDIRGNDAIKENAETRAANELFCDRFFLQLFSGAFKSLPQCQKRAEELNIRYEADWYVVIFCRIVTGRTQMQSTAASNLCASVLRTVKETASKYCPCAVTGIDMNHFAVTLFKNGSQQDAFDAADDISSKMREVLFSYFSVDLFCAAGSCVKSLMDVPLSYKSAEDMEASLSDAAPVIHASSEKKRRDGGRAIENIQAYIKDNIEKKLSLNDVADVFGLTPSYVSQLFSKSGTLGFVEYVTREKIEAAKKIIEECKDIRVYELAEQLGFESAFYFSTVFKKITGTSPSEYKSSCQ